MNQHSFLSVKIKAMVNISVQQLENAIKKLGHQWFDNDSRNYNLNIIGIRSNNRKANKFDDTFSMCWKYKDEWEIFTCPFTTDPGQYWLRNLLNPNGCAILVPGQYDVYSLDLHRGKYEALCQRRGPVKVYRDNNQNDILDMDPKTIKSGDFGINIHHASYDGVTDWVGAHSAGCQVFANINDFVHARSIWRKAAENFGNKFTYSLIKESDL